MDIETRLQAIEARNRQVEHDKAWEVSLTRRFTIALITYLTASVFLTCVLPHDSWYLDACVPMAGYLLSTLSLPWIKRKWQKS